MTQSLGHGSGVFLLLDLSWDSVWLLEVHMIRTVIGLMCVFVWCICSLIDFFSVSSFYLLKEGTVRSDTYLSLLQFNTLTDSEGVCSFKYGLDVYTSTYCSFMHTFASVESAQRKEERGKQIKIWAQWTIYG